MNISDRIIKIAGSDVTLLHSGLRNFGCYTTHVLGLLLNSGLIDDTKRDFFYL